MTDETLHTTMLYDFYGELLTDKQREYFDLYHNEDLSLSEISEKVGISRNGVYDIIKRAEKILIKTEEKTGIVRKWMETQEDINKAIEIVRDLEKASDSKTSKKLDKLSDILNNLIQS